MIGKAWLLKGYYESDEVHPEFPHASIVDVIADDGQYWGCQYSVKHKEGAIITWIAGIPKRYIEFMPPWMLEDCVPSTRGA